MTGSSEHPTAPSTPAGGCGTLALLSDNVHAVVLLDKALGLERGDGLCLFDVGRTDDQFALLEHPGVFEQFVLEGVVDVLFDDDIIRVALLVGQRN